MSGVLVLILGVAVLGGLFAAGLVYAVKRGQFEDLDDPPERMMREE